jgi:hypothetical protein
MTMPEMDERPERVSAARIGATTRSPWPSHPADEPATHAQGLATHSRNRLMPSTPRTRSFRRSTLAVAVIAIAAVAAACTGSAASPSAPPVSQPPSASPSAPAEAPTGQETYVELRTHAAAPSRALVRDTSDSLAGATSGDPAEGASVGWDEVRVESIDDDSLKLTWTDFPIANEYSVLVAMGEDGRFGIQVVRPAPTTDTDTIALDRVLILDFHVAVPLTDVVAGIQPSFDTGS